jgi:hypothetical protein
MRAKRRVLWNPSSNTIFLEVSVTQSTVTSRTIAVEHIKIESGKKFEEVRRALEETIPKLNPAVGEFLRKGDQERAKAEEEYGPKLSIFLDRDHGALLQIAGGTRNARQYEIGNPLTAPCSAVRPAARRPLRRRQWQGNIRIRQALILLRAVRRRASDRGWTLPR